MSERQVPFNVGPPAAIKYFLLLFVILGGVIGVAWYLTREQPKAGPQNSEPAWRLSR